MQLPPAGGAGAPSHSVQAVLNYQAPGVEAVYTKRDSGGSDASLQGAEWDSCQVVVSDGRHSTQPFTLDRNGFALREEAQPPNRRSEDYYDQDRVIGEYYGECEALLKRVTGAAVVKAFDHNVRSAAGKASGRRLVGGSLVQEPAGLVHGDYTRCSAPRRLQQLGLPPKLNDALRSTLGDEPLLPSALVEDALSGKKRFAFINVWRPISTVRSKPLACCDATTVAADDLLVFSIHYADRVGENYFARHSPDHKWVYFSEMSPDEVLLIKQWDTAPCGATFSLHTAFADPSSPPSAPERESIEVRCVLVY